MQKNAYVARLEQVSLFRGLNRKQLALLARESDVIKAEQGEVIVREGELGKEFYVVLNGSVSVRQRGQEVARLSSGDFFGELALLAPGPRDATVVAVLPAELLLVECRRFEPLLEDLPLLSKKLRAVLARRVRESDLARASFM